MSDISLGNLYDMNKQATLSERPLKKHEIKDKMINVKKFFADGQKYFMLLCRERYDFTIFNFNEKTDFSLQHAIKDLQECLENRGSIISIDLDSTGLAYEIWIVADEQAFVYYLFPYDTGVLEQ